MTFVNYQNSNNANTLLIADISASATTLLITEWEQNLFPSQFPFLLTIEHLDTDWNVVLREIVKAISWNQNSFSVVRWFWMCVQDDTASNRVQDNTTHAFSSWDRVSLYRTSEQVKDIQNRLETSANDSAVADEYSSSSTYEEWDIVMYKWDRYICTTAVETAEAFDSTKRTKKSVQLDVSQMQSDIFTLQNSNFASDHLEESWYVWELYAITDRLFTQYTPTNWNSTTDCKVWDIADNSEIHIQRMWSWTATNQLTLKVKKVWSPTTDLIVEVRRWVEVDVSSSEAYRYWWELIASGSITYWNISTSYAEKTITLNNEFWWTAWELLDIVVYQTWKTVNASNYYSVACDSIQYSEAFSYVSINGVSRVRSKYMPYWLSDWFLDSMIVKSEADFTITWSNTFTSGEATLNEYWSVKNWTLSWSTTVSTAWYYQTDLIFTQANTRYYRVKLFINGVECCSVPLTSWWWARTVSNVMYLQAWTYSFSYQYYRDWSWTWWPSYYVKIKWWLTSVSVFKKSWTDWIPQEVKTIWQKSSFITWWNNNWEFYKNDFFDDKVWFVWTWNSATTWSITLWNAVWFLIVQVWTTQYRIPYYE